MRESSEGSIEIPWDIKTKRVSRDISFHLDDVAISLSKERVKSDEERVVKHFRDELTATWEEKVARQIMEVEESKV